MVGHLADCVAAGLEVDVGRLIHDSLLTEEVACSVAAGAPIPFPTSACPPHPLLPRPICSLRPCPFPSRP